MAVLVRVCYTVSSQYLVTVWKYVSRICLVVWEGEILVNHSDSMNPDLRLAICVGLLRAHCIYTHT